MDLFFGDIKLPSSRADDLSDEEFDENDPEPTGQYELLADTFTKTTIEYKQLKTVLVVFGKSDVPSQLAILRLKISTGNGKDEKLGTLFKVSETAVCFVVNMEALVVRSHLVADIVDFLCSKYASLMVSNLEFVILSRHQTEDGKVQYLFNNVGSSCLPVKLLEKKLQSPFSIVEPVQSHLFEYLTIASIPCTYLVLPKFTSTILQEALPSPLWDLLFRKERDYRLFGSKTTFFEAYLHYPSFYDVSPVKLEGEPIMFYYFGRHSIRFPSSQQIIWMKVRLPRLLEEIVNAHNSGNGSLSSEVINELKNWSPKMNCEDKRSVTDSGWEETAKIAKMYYDMVPDLLTASKANIRVGVTNKIRTKQTAEAFLSGLKKYQPDFDVQINDTRYLYVYRICKKELHNLVKNATHSNNQEIVAIMSPVLQNIKTKIGIGRNIEINELKLLHLTCAFEYAIYRYSPWCKLFDRNDLLRMDYLADLNYLSKDLGDIYNRHISCELIKNLLETIKLSIFNPSDRSSSLYFSHSGAIVKLWSVLGIFSEKRNFDVAPDNPNKYLRTSLVDSFNSHLVIILLRTDNGYRLLPLAQGYPVTIKGCRETPCPVEEFFNYYESLFSKCFSSEVCKITKKKAKPENNSSCNRYESDEYILTSDSLDESD